MKKKLILALCLSTSMVYSVGLQVKRIGRHSLKSMGKSALKGGVIFSAGLSAFCIGIGYLADGNIFNKLKEFAVASVAMGFPIGAVFGSCIALENIFENTYNRAVNIVVQHEAKKILAGSTATLMEYNQAIMLHNRLFAFQDLKWLSESDYVDLIELIDKLEQVIDEMGLALERSNK